MADGSATTPTGAGSGDLAAAAAAAAKRDKRLAAAGAAAARAVAEAPSPRTPPPKRDAAGEAVTPEKSREPARGQPPWARLLPRKSSEDLSRYDSRLHFKVGQRFPTPPVADPTRSFYESLVGENPDSKVAIKFCVEYGVLPLEQHQKMYKRYEKLKEKGAYNVQKQIQRALQRKSEKKLRKSLSAEALSAGRAPGAAAEAAK